jgi:hypothetical protein
MEYLIAIVSSLSEFLIKLNGDALKYEWCGRTRCLQLAVEVQNYAGRWT